MTHQTSRSEEEKIQDKLSNGAHSKLVGEKNSKQTNKQSCQLTAVNKEQQNHGARVNSMQRRARVMRNTEETQDIVEDMHFIHLMQNSH